MLKIERQNYILTEIKKNGAVLVTDISLHLDVSTETIRRDLKEMEAQGKLIRMFGGAYIQDDHDKGVPNVLKENFFRKEKTSMAKLAFKYIKQDDVIFLDSSTTCLFIAKEILCKEMSITIITNSNRICNLVENSHNNKVILLGGCYKKKSDEFTGPATIDNIERYMADLYFISCATFDSKFGYYDNTESGASIRKSMIKHSKKTIAVLDHTKFNSKADYRICDCNGIGDIITDVKPSDELRSTLNKNKINIEY